MAIDWPLFLQGADIVLDAIAQASWPIAFGAVAYAFRKPIVALIGRIKKLNAFGGEAEFGAMPRLGQETADASSVVDAARRESLPAPEGSIANLTIPELPPAIPLYDQFDGGLRQELEKLIPGTTERRLAWAIRARTIAEIERLHEVNYRNIFGSQIAALKGLNGIGGVGLVEHFRPFYDQAAANTDWKALYLNRPFETWGQFLIDAGYVELVEGSEPAQVSITLMGQDFLHWLLRMRVSEFKPG